MRDIHSIDGKFPPPEARYEVVVIGAGPAGIAAALEAARGGAQVLLVDENPVSAGLMGTDAPLFYGQRMTGAVQAKERMVEQVFAASPGLEEAFELGVNVQLGVYAWGAFTGGYGLKSLPEPVVGLADEERSWVVGFDRLIVAAGARDLALSFPGWDQPGVMGANGLHALLARYDAFSGRRLVILGSGQLALETALLALEHGLEVAALVEVRDAVQGPEALADKVRAAGVQILTGQVIQRAEGGLDGVERILVAPVADSKTRGQAIDCDTVCLAIGLIPAVELLDVLGAPLVADAARGGFVPVLDGAVVQGMSSVQVVGDAAGLDLGHADAHAYQTDWMRALIAAGDPSVIVCQCEEVSREALLAVRQPAYLGPPSNKMAERDIATLAEDGPVNQDQVKRLTRACMGVCQARRCREQVALTLAVATDTPVAQIPLAGYRAPVRPLPLKVLAAWDEAEAMSQGWDVWFGIPTQWTPYADIGTDREARHAEILGGNMHL